MSAKILIVDSVATNRIVLKVKMLSAQFHVETCATFAQAMTRMAKDLPDLVLLNLGVMTAEGLAFCRRLREESATERLAIVGVQLPDTPSARLAALEAGMDDVMPQPLHEGLLLARIRSLLRTRNVWQEVALRETTSRILGFSERRKPFALQSTIRLVTGAEKPWEQALAKALGAKISRAGAIGSVQTMLGDAAASLIILDAAFIATCSGVNLFSLVADLRSRPNSRDAGLIVLLPANDADTTAMCLDLGVDDVIFATTDGPEVIYRATAVRQHRLAAEALRETVRSDLRAAMTDPLTGLFNRRYAGPHLARMAEAAKDHARELAVMMIDIDHFKTINDRYGHAAGDAVLQQVAQRLHCNLRAEDLIARMGGEEFLVAMPNTTPHQAGQAATRLCKVINDSPFAVGEHVPRVNVSISVGLVVSGKKASAKSTFETLYGSADAALYAAKAAGRNRVAIGSCAS